MERLYQVVYNIFNMNDNEELLEVVNEDGAIIRTLPRSVIHGDPSLIHRVVHILVFNKDGALLLQKRSINKDVAPGRWDTSVGGHVNKGETIDEAVRREMAEELGIASCDPRFLYSYIHSNPYETELVYTFSGINDGEIKFNQEEIDDVRFWGIDEIRENIGSGTFSDNFEEEFRMYMNKSRGLPL